uniref:Uncharacterized protein n=1 Tax=Plectus sambesii TaxID=2011161 RepID=A0A914X8I6_9BILA
MNVLANAISKAHQKNELEFDKVTHKELPHPADDYGKKQDKHMKPHCNTASDKPSGGKFDDEGYKPSGGFMNGI